MSSVFLLSVLLSKIVPVISSWHLFSSQPKSSAEKEKINPENQ